MTGSILDGEVITSGDLAYMRSRTRNRLYNCVIGSIMEQEKQGFDRGRLARRIGISEDELAGLLGSPQGWSIDTICDLLAAISEELEPDTKLIGSDQ